MEPLLVSPVVPDILGFRTTVYKHEKGVLFTGIKICRFDHVGIQGCPVNCLYLHEFFSPNTTADCKIFHSLSIEQLPYLFTTGLVKGDDLRSGCTGMIMYIVFESFAEGCRIPSFLL